MPNFLDLSRELRDMIYESIAFFPQQDVFGELRNGQWKDRKPLTDFRFQYSRDDGSNVLYSTTPFEPIRLNNLTLRSMSRTNRQLHAETLEFLRKSSRKTSYYLDVALINNETLLPGWVSVPALVMHVDKLSVAVHPMSFSKAGWGPGVSGNSSSPLWSFYGILERFLSFGPIGPTGWSMGKRQNFRCHRSGVCRLSTQSKILIKTLEIDIVTPKLEFAILPSNNIKNAHQNALAMSESVLGRFQNFFDTLLPMDIAQRGKGWSNASYEGLASVLMYEHIGKIRLLHNGRFAQEWDLGKLLRTLELSSLFRNVHWEERYWRVWKNPERSFEYWHLEVQEYRARYAGKLS